MRRAVAIASLLLLAPSVASAHHVVSTSGIAWVEPVTVAEAELAAASFDFGPELRGTWQTLAVRGEIACFDRASFSVRVPWTHLRLADGRGALGLGDIELAGKARLVTTEHGGLLLSAGLGLGLPTGDPAVGIGSGHTELAPFIAASSHPVSWLVLDGLLTQKWSVGGSAPNPDAHHGALVAPHADNESVAQLGVSAVWRAWYLRASSVGTLAHQSPQDGVDAALELGFAMPERFRISLGGSIPVAGSPRFDWQSRLAVAAQFN